MADGLSPFINKLLWVLVRQARQVGSWAVGLALLLIPLGGFANHYSGGSITYRCLGAGQYQITLDLFLDCAGVPIIAQSLNFHSDCGEDFAINGLTFTSSEEVSQLCAAALPQSTCNGGPYFGIRHYQFQTVVALAPCDDWTIWWYICCRSGSVDLTGFMGMYIEANVNTALAACDNSPVFADQSLPYVCVNQPVYYNFGVNEPDGDSIAYRFISARYFGGVPQPVVYNAGYSGGTPVPGITLDPVTGQIVFTPTAIGNYVIAIEVEQFDANGNSIGTVMRDIMFVVMACTGSVPTIQGNVSLTGPPGTATLTGPSSIDVCDGSPFCFSLTFNDPDPATVLNVTSQAAALLPGSTTTVTGANPAVVQVCWTADADHSPVNVLFQAADGACPIENTASVSVNITSSVNSGPPNAGANGAVTVCPGTPPVDLFTALGGTPDADGHWLSPSNGPHSGQFIVGTDVAGVYTYVAGNACGSATATVTVTVSNGPSTAGTNGTLSICSNAPAQTLFDDLGGSPQAGGTWTGPGGVPHGAIYDPAVDAGGVYTYTVAGGGACPAASATVTVTEVAAPFAGGNGTLSTCSNGAAVALFASLTGTPQAGGTWTGPGGAAHGPNYDPAVDGPGVYTYTVAGTAPCANATATVTVTENAMPNAGMDGILSLCSSGAATNLFPLLAGAQGGGTWTAPGGVPFSGTYDPAVNASGAYTYTVAGTAPCANDLAVVTVTESTPPNAGADGILTTCSNSGTSNLFLQLAGAQGGGTWTAPGGGAFSGTYDPAVHAAGVYTYTVAGVAPCGNDQATVTVTESLAPSAGVDGVLTICSNGPASGLLAQLAGAQGGGTWTAPGGGVFSGTYDPAVDGPGIYTYTVAGVAPCLSDQAVVTVTENAAPNAGTDGTLTTCSNSSTNNLFGALVGAQGGGSWTAPGGGAFGGTYDPAVDGPGVYTYTVAGIAPCGNDQATVTVTETAAPDAGADGSLTTCDISAPTNLFTTLIGAQAGGAWTTPGGLAFGGTYDPAVDAPGIYTYTVAGLAPCSNDQATVTVTENAAPSAGANGTLTTCSNSGTTNLFGQLTGAQGGGTWMASGGGPFSGTYDPAVDAPGVYLYTIVGPVPCGSDQASVTVTENAAPDAGLDGNLAVCSNGAAVGLFAELTGAPAGGTWTTPGGAAFSGTYDPVVDAPGLYTYTVAGAAPCASDQAVVTIQESQAPSAGNNGLLSICTNSAAAVLFTQLMGADLGGTWTDPSGNLFGGIYDPSSDTPGAYTYTVTGPLPCGSDQAIVTVVETVGPFAGADVIFGICSANAPTNLFPQLPGAQPGGTWTGPLGGPFSGVYDPAMDGSGAYTYTVAGSGPCAADQAVVNVVEGQAPQAGADATLDICSDSPAASLFPLLVGAQPGGTWTAPGGGAFSGTYDPAVNGSGVYTYSVPNAPPCLGDQATVTVTEHAAPNAGMDGATTVCDQGAAIDLFGELTGADAGGSWTSPGGSAHSNLYDPAVDSPGTYTYTVAGVAPCGAVQSIVVVQETGAPSAGLDGNVTLCSTSGATDLFNALTGADPDGTWTSPGGAAHSNMLDPALDAAGVYTYTIAAVMPCAGDQSQVTVAINTAPDAGADGATTVCDQGAAIDLFNELTGADAGGTWTAPGGGAHSNLYDPAVDSPGTYTYTVAGAAPCGVAQSVVVVQETGTPNAGTDGVVTLCSTSGAIDLFGELGGPDAGGSWTAPVGASHSNMLDPALDAAGVYTYTIAAVAPCAGDQSQVTVVINAAPDAGTDGATTVCDQGAAIDLFGELTGADAGGSWTSPGGSAHSNLYDPAVDSPGTYTYMVAGTAPCGAAQSVVVVQETGTPNAGTDGVVTLCSTSGAIDLFGELGGPDAGGSWTAPGGTSHSNMLDPSLDAAGVYTYTIAAVAPCAGDQSQVTVAINAAPDAGTDGATTVCDQGAAIDLFGELTGADAGGSWTSPGGAAHGNLYDPAVDSPGTYTYTVAGAAPCGAVQSVVVVQETGTPNAGTDGVVTLCSTNGAIDLFGELGGPDAGGSWTAPGGAAHSNMLDPSLDAAGVYTYTIAAVAPCAGDQSQVTVVINTAPDAGTDGATTVCDQGTAIDLFGELTGADAGGSWTSPGGSAHSNLYDPAVDAPGTYTYTVAGTAPCGAAQSVVVVQEASTPNAGSDGAITLCSAGTAIDLFGQLGGAPDAGGTWTSPGGAVHGSTLDPATDAAGTYTYTIAAAAPCMTASATVAVSIDPAHDAGTNGAVSVCTGDTPFALVDHLGGTPDAGGSWTGPGGAASSGTFDPATSTPGVYSYLLSGNACPDALSSVTVAVLSGPNAGQDNSVVFCSSDALVDLVDQLLGVPEEGGTWTGPDGLPAGATFDPATSVAGTYTYTVPGNAACPAATADVIITVSEAVSAGTIGISTLCSTGAVVDLFEALNGFPDPGGTWTDPHNAPFDGTYDPAADEPGVYTYTVAAAAPCPTASAGITVEVNAAPDAGTSTTVALCADNAPVGLNTLIGGTPDAGGTWTAPDGTAFGGLFDPATAQPGTYTYQVTGIAPCAADQATVTVGVAQPADAGADGAVSLCSNAAPFDLLPLLAGTPDAGGAWTAPDGTPSTATLDPATAASGAYVYTVTPPAPCPQAIAMVQVDIITVPVVEPMFTMTTGCAPVEVTFTSGYAGAGACHWDFGNDSTSADCGPVTMLYTEPGTYAVTFTADPGNGCATVVTLDRPVNVYPPPTAAFGIVATGIHTQDPIAAFDNQSTGALGYLWRFGDVGTSTDEDPQFTFPYDVEANYPVCLIAYAAPTCTDTLCQDLFVPAGSSVFTPNAFTPDGDGINDGFAPNTRALNAEEYHFYIFDRWGQPLYDTRDPNAHWDGHFRNGMEVPEGVYVWKLVAMDAVTGERFEDIGHVSLVR